MIIDFETTATFDVDAQKGFTPVCVDELPVTDGDKIVDELNKMSSLAKYRVGSKDAHCLGSLHIADKDNPQFSKVENTKNIDIRWNKHCIMGTRGAESLDGLPHWSEYDFFVWKGIEPDTHPYGACYHTLDNSRSTGVIEWLKLKGIKTVIVGGLATDFCVKHTTLQLSEAGFSVIINLRACRAINAPTENGSTTLLQALNEMKASGVIFVESF